MERMEIELEFMKAIAPVMVQEGMRVQQQVANAGGNPGNCTVGGKDIPHSFAESAKVWAKAFADEYLAE